MNILEIGTYTGYSACLCEGMQENGILHTIDIKEELVEAKHFWQIALGSADHTTPRWSSGYYTNTRYEIWFGFIDADKENYINYFNIILPKWTKEGLSFLIMYCGGKVLEPHERRKHKKYYWIQRFTKKWPRVETVLLPIRDGLTVSRVI
jgi:predicted O-methyltransferase YrrM